MSGYLPDRDSFRFGGYSGIEGSISLETLGKFEFDARPYHKWVIPNRYDIADHLGLIFGVRSEVESRRDSNKQIENLRS